MASVPQPTTFDKAMMAPYTVRMLFAALFRLITRPIDSSPKPADLFRDVVFAALRVNISSVNVAQEQWLNGSTEQAYLDSAKKHYFAPNTDELESGLKVHWVGPRLARQTLIWFHGGGYSLAGGAGHMEWLWDLKEALAQQYSISIAIPSYSLAPEAQYPTQLKQGVEVVQYVVKEKGASNVFIAGDSAGGNLATGIMSHVLHPHSDIPELKLNQPLAAAVLISPWTKFGTDDDSVKRYRTSDILTPVAANRWTSAFLGSAKPDNYNQPCMADSKWFDGLNKVVREILVYGGSHEVLIDSIDAFVKQLKSTHSRVDYVRQAGAYHIDFIIDKLLGYQGKGEGSRAVESWIAGRLETRGY